MNKLKKISWLVVSLVGLFLTYSATANQNYGDWIINDNNPDIQISLFMENEYKEKIMILCSESMYLAAVNLRYVKEDKNKNRYFFDYQIDNHSVIFEGTRHSLSWIVPNIEYNYGKNQVSGEIDKYRVLFQQMLKAKESLTVNAIDEHGKIYHSISFSVKGLPEALVEFAKQCGTDFQTYSGIDIN